MKNFTSCFKEKKFLHFFYTRVRKNDTGKYELEFPYVSLCGRERNYIRCDDVPCVFTNLLLDNNEDHLSIGHADKLLTQKFEPESIYMFDTGRIYHPAHTKYGGYGLMKSSLAIDLSNQFIYPNENHERPSHIMWQNKKFALNENLKPLFEHLSVHNQ